MTDGQFQPREWWILENQPAMFLSGLIAASPIKCLDGTHVIEYSAYLALKQKLEVALEALKKYANPETHSMDVTGFVWSGSYFDYETAREAIERIGK